MKRKFLSVFSALIILTLAACGPAPAPTLSAPDVANTAMAVAWTQVILTQAAIPTATPLPPTPIPLPTILPFPTLPPIVPTIAPATLASNPTTDPCNAPPPFEPKGTMVQVRFVNKSGGSVNLSFGMIQPNSLGECGTYSFSMGRYEEPEVKVLAGCYWAYAWITGDKPSIAKNIESLCITDPNRVRGITIGPEVVGFD